MAKPVVKKKIKFDDGNISKYVGHKVILTMEKPKSPLSVAFYADPEDDFMINAVEFKKKTGIITHDSLIIQPDIENFVSLFGRSGFAKV